VNKSFIYLTAAVAGLALASCGSNATEAGAADSALSATEGSATYTVSSESTLGWKGTKVVGMGSHAGTIGISEGTISLENGNITAGSVTIDMNKIVVTDSGMTDETKQKLIGHFSSDDFFNVEQFPTAKFEITGSEAKAEGDYTHVISGNLTLRDSTKNISFPATVAVDENGVSAVGTAVFNRLDWGVNYDKEKMSLTEKLQATAKNGIVSKDIEVTFNIKATK
jgi:polyisoprenoid-binding protein YceI